MILLIMPITDYFYVWLLAIITPYVIYSVIVNHCKQKQIPAESKYQLLLEYPRNYYFGKENISNIPNNNTLLTALKKFCTEQEIYKYGAIVSLSGGVDSTVAATLIQRAIGDNLYCIFVDNGLLRKDEFTQVLEGYKQLHLNTKGIDARHRFYTALAGESDPEKKRKIIGGLFIDIFQEEAQHFSDVSF
jgi:hypothetical protein